MVSIPIYKATLRSPALNVVFVYRLKSMAGKEKDFAALDPAMNMLKNVLLVKINPEFSSQ